MNWNFERAIEREEEALHEAYARGEMDSAELSKAIRDLHRDARRQLEEAAQDAYDDVIGYWR